MRVGARVVMAAAAGMVFVMSATFAQAGPAAVPEPATVTLLGTGAAAMGLVAWWRNRK